jgi:hypothetical protein
MFYYSSFIIQLTFVYGMTGSNFLLLDINIYFSNIMYWIDHPFSLCVLDIFVKNQFTGARHGVHACNPSYLEAEIRRIAVWSQPR